MKGNFHSVEEPLKSWLELAGKPGESPFLVVGTSLILILLLLPCLFLPSSFVLFEICDFQKKNRNKNIIITILIIIIILKILIWVLLVLDFFINYKSINYKSFPSSIEIGCTFVLKKHERKKFLHISMRERVLCKHPWAAFICGTILAHFH